MIRKEDLFVAGRIVKAHGIKGECVLSMDTDVLADADCIICDIDGLLIPFYITERRQKNDRQDIIMIDGIDGEKALEPLLGSPVYLSKTLQADIEDVSYDYFTGFTVIANGREIGEVVDVDDSTMNVLMTVSDGNNEYMIPLVEDFLSDVDHSGRRLMVEVPDDLLSLN